jgi:hypothetical protein
MKLAIGFSISIVFAACLIWAQNAPATSCCSDTALGATCVGATPCKACKNCSSCKHCKKNGGKCGACAKN